MAVIGFMAIVALPILLSRLFGQSLDQFAFTEDFSFSIGGTSASLTILLAATIEEVGWRGYGEESVASYLVILGMIIGLLMAVAWLSSRKSRLYWSKYKI